MRPLARPIPAGPPLAVAGLVYQGPLAVTKAAVAPILPGASPLYMASDSRRPPLAVAAAAGLVCSTALWR